jgi:hypothetical protein
MKESIVKARLKNGPGGGPLPTQHMAPNSYLKAVFLGLDQTLWGAEMPSVSGAVAKVMDETARARRWLGRTRR